MYLYLYTHPSIFVVVMQQLSLPDTFSYFIHESGLYQEDIYILLIHMVLFVLTHGHITFGVT